MKPKNKRALRWAIALSLLTILFFEMVFVGWSYFKTITSDNPHITISFGTVGVPIIIGLATFPIFFLYIRFNKKKMDSGTLATSRFKTLQELNDEFPWIQVINKKPNKKIVRNKKEVKNGK